MVGAVPHEVREEAEVDKAEDTAGVLEGNTTEHHRLGVETIEEGVHEVVGSSGAGADAVEEGVEGARGWAMINTREDLQYTGQSLVVHVCVRVC